MFHRGVIKAEVVLKDVTGCPQKSDMNTFPVRLLLEAYLI
jgi:hypothetical protein